MSKTVGLPLRTKDLGCGLDCAKFTIFMVGLETEGQQFRLASTTVRFIGCVAV